MLNQLIKQQQIEKLYNKNQVFSRIKEEIVNYENGLIISLIQEAGMDLECGIDLLVQMILHKRANVETLVGVLKNHAKNSLQEIVDQLELAIQAGLVEYNPVTKFFIVAIDIPEDVQQEINQYQYPMPMVVPPKAVTNNGESGYLSVNTSILLNKTHHNDDVVLDHINRVNGIQFELNLDVVHFIQNTWKNLDQRKPGESVWDFKKRKAAFEKYDQNSRAIIEFISEHSDVMYFTHRYDFRGRIYCQGYHITYAGNDWNKACVSLAKKEPING